jgi:hypothetical protein
MNRIFVHIKDGEIQNKKVVANAFKLPDGKYQVDIKKAGGRSLSQNAYFHAILPEILQSFREHGYGPEDIAGVEDLKLIFKSMFLKRVIADPVTGEAIEVVRDTHKLTKEEMSVFIEDVVRWCADKLHLTIYSPNEQTAIPYEA